MSTLQCANIWFESSANNRIQYNGSNSVSLIVSGANAITSNSTVTYINGSLGFGSATGASAMTGNTSVTQILVNGSNAMVSNSTGTYTSTNTFGIGTSTVAATGYSYLSNGLKMNWGLVVANSVGANVVTLSSPYTTNVYSLQLTILGTNTAAATVARANNVNSSVFTIVCGNSTVLNNTNITGIYYTTIGI